MPFFICTDGGIMDGFEKEVLLFKGIASCLNSSLNVNERGATSSAKVKV